MNRPFTMACLRLVVVAAIPGTALADKVSTHGNSPNQVEGRCGNAEGGVYFPPNKLGVYGCMNGDGSGIVCGGTGKDKKTCDTWTAALRVLPTRDQIRERQKHMKK